MVSKTNTNSQKAKLVEGSIPRHVIEISLMGSVGLIGIFLVDLFDMYFLSLLADVELTAAVGYASSVTFFTTSVCIGLSIATGIIQARMIGADEHLKAKEKFLGSILLSFIVSLVVLLILLPSMQYTLEVLGASGKTLLYAKQYIEIVMPTLPFLALAMCFAGVLRSLGAAKSSMWVTLCGSIVNGILDPIFIFSLELGIEGAALASAAARIAMFIMGSVLLIKHYHYYTSTTSTELYNSALATFKLSVPAVLTNFATPVGNAYVVSVMSNYDDDAVSGFAIIGRIIPIAFAIVFSLSGAVGPIIGQNLGAKNYHRIQQTISFSYLFVSVYVSVTWLLLLIIANWLVDIFGATGEAANLLLLFCNIASLSFIFTGITFVSNAVFNNLGKPHYSTVMNWLKATLGTVPFVYIGSIYSGSQGVLIGQAIGSIVFGIASFLFLHYFFNSFKQTNIE